MAIPPPTLRKAIPPPLPPAIKVTKMKPPPLPNGRTFLNEEELARFHNLISFAKQTVEARFAGRHKSHDFGTGGEFAEHKQYHPGLPVSAIDWHVYARTKKLFIRTYDELTDLAVHLVTDVSGSMSFVSAGNEMKGSRSARIAASLAHLMIRQGDKVSLTMFADKVLDHLPCGGTSRHLERMLMGLASPSNYPNGKTKIADSLRETALLAKRRGRLVVLSDFLGEDPEEILEALSPFLHRRFEILLLQISDPQERTLPHAPLARFVDLETQEELEIEPEEIRENFAQTVRERTTALKTGAMRRRVDFARLGTESPYLDAIEAYLGFRNWSDTDS